MTSEFALKELIMLSNDLDRRRLYKEADFLDIIIFKQAQEQKQSSVGAFVDTAVVIASKGLGFIENVAAGVETLGSFMESSGIPGVAFVGAMLEQTGGVTEAAAKLAPVFKDILSVISEKIEEARESGGSFCISLDDFDSKTRESVRLLLGLLVNAAYGPALASAMKIKDSLMPYAKLIPGLSESISSLQNDALALSMCFGEGSNISQDADSVDAYIADKTNENKQSIYDYANLIAKNTQQPRAPVNPTEGLMQPVNTDSIHGESAYV